MLNYEFWKMVVFDKSKNLVTIVTLFTASIEKSPFLKSDIIGIASLQPKQYKVMIIIYFPLLLLNRKAFQNVNLTNGTYKQLINDLLSNKR